MKNILVIDDNQNSRELIKYALKNDNNIINEADDGDMAMDILLNSPPDLVILDWLMPRLSGKSMILLTDDIFTQIDSLNHTNSKRIEVIVYSSTKMSELKLPKAKYFKYLCYVSKEWSISKQIERIRKISNTSVKAA
tara:strand:+ start:64979 stop:65389 length:411 start_codon:yes stop_codon:yes gene_type:complete